MIKQITRGGDFFTPKTPHMPGFDGNRNAYAKKLPPPEGQKKGVPPEFIL